MTDQLNVSYLVPRRSALRNEARVGTFHNARSGAAFIVRPLRCSVDDMFAQIASAHSSRAQLAGSRITYVRSITTVNADRRLLERALGGVVAFALPRLQRGSRVVLATRRDADHDEIQISIPGLIVSDEDRLLHDEPASISGESEWRLALRFCRRALRAHGGEMVVDCEQGGTVVRLLLPRAQGTAEGWELGKHAA